MVNDHQVKHPEFEHPLVFSFADFSFWCYACDDYVVHHLLTHSAFFTLQKFGEDATLKE